MIKINLVPQELLARARQRQMILQASAVGAVVAGFFVLVSLNHVFGLYRMQNDYKYDESRLQSLKAVVAQVEEAEKAAGAVRSRLKVIDDLLKGRAFYPIFMSDFARTVPATVRVTNLTTSTQANNATKLSISATAQTSDDIASWMRTLQGDAHFAGIELGAVTASGVRQYSFTITATYAVKL